MVSLAFLVSFIFLAYLVIPAGLFRFFAGFGLPLRKFHKNRVEEISFAIVVCFFPYLFALLFTWCVFFFNNQPFSVRKWEIKQPRREAYKVFLVGSLRRDLAGDGAFWAAVTQVGRRQARFLLWYWIFVSVEAGIYVILIRGRRNLGFFRVPLLKGLSDWYILYPYLQIKDKPIVLLDIRTGDDDLVKGRLNDFFLNAEGDLSGLLLQDPVRRRRRREVEDHGEEGDSLPWRYIPSRVLYIPFNSLTDMNVRYVTEKEFNEIPEINYAIETYLTRFLRRKVPDAVVKVLPD